MKYFLVLLVITFASYSQHIDVTPIMNSVAESINITLKALEEDRINEAIMIAAETDEALGRLDYRIYLKLNAYMYPFINQELKNQAIACYCKQVETQLKTEYDYTGYIDYDYFLAMPKKAAYFLIFTNDSCKKSWCNFQRYFLSRYEYHQKNYRKKRKKRD